ncbi:hypothetical protein [Kitasatospora terrestris]|uniref:Secreted protein n=1 Tax=Kitasatospora terrestris TaxID=258051 RepID=A0ABP9EN23_9ACTN
MSTAVASCAAVLVPFCCLVTYLGTTLTAFLTASPERVRTWARRESRGTVLQRYLLGAAPGPGRCGRWWCSARSTEHPPGWSRGRIVEVWSVSSGAVGRTFYR